MFYKNYRGGNFLTKWGGGEKFFKIFHPRPQFKKILSFDFFFV
jgi:hypothetical protein